MPRAATAIIAIACSASYLSGDAGTVPAHALRCVPKTKKQGRAVSKRPSLKQGFVSHYVTTGPQDDTILAHLDWSTEGGDILAVSDVVSSDQAFTKCSEMGGDIDVFAPARCAAKVLRKDGAATIGSLPEDILVSTLAYAGVSGRAVCRASLRCSDNCPGGSSTVPSFPVDVSVKQYCYFGHNEPVTTTWNFNVAAPTSPSFLDVSLDTSSDELCNIERHQSPQSAGQVLRLCQELRALQTSLGVHHKEAGRTQVEVVATDAAGRTVLNHNYEHRIFCSKADDLLELLTESHECNVPDIPQANVEASSRGTRSRAPRPRPASRTR